MMDEKGYLEFAYARIVSDDMLNDMPTEVVQEIVQKDLCKASGEALFKVFGTKMMPVRASIGQHGLEYRAEFIVISRARLNELLRIERGLGNNNELDIGRQ